MRPAIRQALLLCVVPLACSSNAPPPSSGPNDAAPSGPSGPDAGETPADDSGDQGSEPGTDAGGASSASDASYGSSVEASSTSTTTDASGHSIAPGGYYVEGNTIYDASGHAHLFHGVDRTSFEWNAMGQYISASDYTTMAGSWKANVVRIPLNQDFWLAASPIYDSGYANVIDEQVTNARAAGLDVILDLHWSDKGTLSAASASTLGTLPGQQRMADANSVTFWQEVATKYKDNGHVVFELYNEPHDIPWNVWLGGGNTGSTGAGGAAFTAVGMQTLYDTVRATGANNLVLVGGVNWAYDLSGVPANRVSGFNIAYVSHVYDHTTGHSMSDWPSNWGFLAATDPIVLTEFGPFSNQGNDVDCDLTFVTDLLTYADSLSVSWSSWAWWVYTNNGTDDGSDYCDYPSLLLSRDGTPNALGQIVQTHLATY